MPVRHATLTLATSAPYEVRDITREVEAAVRGSGAADGLCAVFTPHATAAVTINENDDPNVGADLLDALSRLVKEHDGWRHDRVDDNAAAHIKAAIVGPSETIPVREGRLALGTWQNVFFCEFGGPRATRRVHVTVLW
ncbi:MAG TPA: secondary thiamine-phosphate synthase enzyme YjbQ [Thermoanaerobaculia bacterium]|nr:secondary thiamine-phosphate synthase enzyme YjbQ [Thermoanaerobaculia bacterium]